MNIWVMSDLHLEYRDYKLDPAGFCPPHASVLVLAGDVGNGVEAVEWMNRQQERIGLPIIFVPGNHDFFDYDGTDMFELLEQMKAAANPCVHILYNERIEVSGVRFLGTTLWTDYRYSDPPGKSERELMLSTSLYPDYFTIHLGGEKFTPEDSVRLHHEARDWLESELLGLRDRDKKPRVVVTHFLPSPRSLDPRFKGKDTSAAFCSELPDALLGLADVWLHGHSHYAQDWRGPGGVHVVCNPMGYSDDGEAPGFDPVKWVTV